MKKRIISIVMLVILTLGSVFTFSGCEQIKFSGEIETPVYDTAQKSMLINRIKELDGLNNLAVAQMYDVSCYTSEVDGEVSYTTKYTKGFSDAERTEKLKAKAVVDISNYAPVVYNNITYHRGIKQYVKFKISEEERRNDFKIESYKYNNSMEQYAVSQGIIESESKNTIENWIDTSEVAYQSDTEIQNLTWTYVNSSSESSRKSDGNSSSSKESTQYKSKARVSLNDYASLWNMILPFMTQDATVVDQNSTAAWKFKDNIMIYTNDNEKYKLSYAFSHEETGVHAVTGGLLAGLLDSFSYDTHYTTYEAILVIGKDRGQFDLKVTVVSSMIDNVESTIYGNYTTETKMDVTITIKSNNDSVSMPSNKDSYKER